jgi:mRNA interferase MazF
MHRGETWWVDFPLPTGRRPALLLSRDSAYKVRTSITVAIITKTIRHIPVEVPLDAGDGMASPCVVNLDDIITIPKPILMQRISSLSTARMAEVSKAIAFALDLAV